MVVVLPEPLGPSSPKISPRFTWRSSDWRARTFCRPQKSRYTLVRFRVSTTGCCPEPADDRDPEFEGVADFMTIPSKSDESQAASETQAPATMIPTQGTNARSTGDRVCTQS